MSVQVLNNNYYRNILQQKLMMPYSVPFKGCVQETLTHTNIGSCLNGYIGKVSLKNDDGTFSFLSVFKHKENPITENYKIKDDFGNVIGETKIIIRKHNTNVSCFQGEDLSHVFVDELRNYSKPNTPYHNKNLKHYKGVGIRLLQIAQRRSDEAFCNGNIELIAKNESKPFYFDVIKMKEKYPEGSFERKFNNPNKLYLPPEEKERLSKLMGGI